MFTKDRQYFKFCLYGFLKNLRFFDAFFILFLVEQGLPYTQIGLLYAIREICINIFEIPSGILADTYGKKNSLILSFFFYILSFYIFYSATNFWFFLFAFIFYGLGDAFRSGTHKAMIMEYLRLQGWEKSKINYYGYTRSWSQKGSALSSLVAGVIVFYSGKYSTIFLYSIIPYLINLLLILSYPKELNLSFHKDKKKIKLTIFQTFNILVKSIKDPQVIKIINTSAMHTAYLRAIKDYIQPLMVNIAILIPIMVSTSKEKKSGLVIGIIYFLIYLATAYASKFSSKLEESNKKNVSRKTLLIGFLLGITCGIFYIYNIWIAATIAFAGIYIIENIRKPILTGYIAESVPKNILTSVISIQSFVRTSITAILALVLGILADKFGIGYGFVVVSFTLFSFTILINIIGNKMKV